MNHRGYKRFGLVPEQTNVFKEPPLRRDDEMAVILYAYVLCRHGDILQRMISVDDDGYVAMLLSTGKLSLMWRLRRYSLERY